MLALGMNEAEITPLLNQDFSLAAVNSPKHCVVSGKTGAIEQLEKQLSEPGKNVFNRRLRTSHAFHSPLMEPMMDKFAAAAANIQLQSPRIPFISCVTGTWIREEQACSPQYWAQQLRETVRFSDGIQEILKEGSPIFLELGPGSSLSVLAKEHQKENPGPSLTFSSIRHFKQTEPDMMVLLKTLGNLWLSGVSIDWQRYYQNEQRYRIPLPTYPFERKRYWLAEVKEQAPGAEIAVNSDENAALEKESRQEGDTSGTAPADSEEKISKTFQPRPQLNSEYFAPTNDIERCIGEIWEDILGIKPVGIHDNFFDLGGHSLLATLFLSRLQEELGVRLELRSIFENPTIAVIAESVKTEADSSGDIKDLESLLTEIEGLSQDEVQVALSEQESESVDR